MNVPLLIARRYFSSKKKRNIISIISNISMIGVAVGTMALIIVLSVFNGLEDLVRSLYSKSDPDLVISAAKGKAFEATAPLLIKLRATPGVGLVTEVIEDNALLQYHDRQMVVKMKGVSENFFAQSNIDSALVEGDHRLMRNGEAYALLGAGVQHELSIALNNRFAPLHLLYPRNTGKKTLSINPENAFTEQNIFAGGVFLIEQHIDDSYIFVPLEFAKSLLTYGNKRTSLEIRVGKPYT
ncbi:MAG TPA: ABC transporter permease, partial [Hymenobacter sp.]